MLRLLYTVATCGSGSVAVIEHVVAEDHFVGVWPCACFQASVFLLGAVLATNPDVVPLWRGWLSAVSLFLFMGFFGTRCCVDRCKRVLPIRGVGVAA